MFSRYSMQDMNTEKTLEIDSSSYEATLRLSSQIGERLRGGEIFELIGDLGAGKTGFTSGLVAGAGSNDEVSSPSFTINNLYQTEMFEINHFDFYRLEEAGVMSQELVEVLGKDKSVTLIEWGDVVHDVLPSERVKVKIEHREGDNRHFIFMYTPEFEYLFEGMSE